MKMYFIAACALLLAACGNEPSDKPASAASSTTSSNAAGKTAFMRCMACHSLNAGEPHKLGPNLHGIVGAQVATREDFDYSKALADSGLTWDAATLKAWIENPVALVPGTKMIYANSLSDAQIDALIDYMNSNEI